MIAIVALLALPLGYLVRNPTVAYVAYAVTFAHLYTFQTATLVMEWVNGADAAFAQTESRSVWSVSVGYLEFTTVVLVLGFALLALGQWLRARRIRRSGRSDVADLEVELR